MANEFFLTREGSAGNNNEQLHFAATLKRTLSLAEGKRLRDKLTELLAEPKAEAPKAPEPTPEVAAPKRAAWGTAKTAK